MRIAVFGLGKLGLPMAVLFASRGHYVVGVDNDSNLITELRRGVCKLQESGVESLLNTHSSKLTFTTDPKVAMLDSQISFIMVPTPSNLIGTFTSDYIIDVVKKIAPIVPQNHIVVVTSTVTPGTTANEIKPILESSGRVCGKDFGLLYNPEFIALGSVIRDMSSPDGILIGESDKHSGDVLEEFYHTICNNRPQVSRMSWWNAEVAKLALNVTITAKISIVNTFARVCEKIPGGNIDDVARFLGSDSRIGPKYLSSGLGFGGPCFPRDNRAFISFATLLGASQCPLQIATDALNESQVAHAVSVAIKMLSGVKAPTVSLLGLTYKTNTPVIDESRAVKMAQRMSVLANLRVYDPQGMNNAQRVLKSERITFTDGVTSCIAGSDLCIVATTWDEFKVITPVLLSLGMRRPALFDCWRMLKREEFERENIPYHAIGVNSEG